MRITTKKKQRRLYIYRLYEQSKKQNGKKIKGCKTVLLTLPAQLKTDMQGNIKRVQIILKRTHKQHNNKNTHVKLPMVSCLVEVDLKHTQKDA